MGTRFRRGVELFVHGIDEDANEDLFGPKCFDGVFYRVEILHDIEAAFGGHLLAPLRHQANDVGFNAQVYLDNLRRILPKGSMLPVPITCTARFGAPLRLEPGEEKAEFLHRARAAVLALDVTRPVPAAPTDNSHAVRP